MLDQRQRRWAGVVQMLCKCLLGWCLAMLQSYGQYGLILSQIRKGEQSESSIVNIIVLGLHNYTPGSI